MQNFRKCEERMPDIGKVYKKRRRRFRYPRKTGVGSQKPHAPHPIRARVSGLSGLLDRIGKNRIGHGKEE